MSLLSYKDLRNGQMMRLGLIWTSLRRKIFTRILFQQHERIESLEEQPTSLDRVKCTTPSKTNFCKVEEKQNYKKLKDHSSRRSYHLNVRLKCLLNLLLAMKLVCGSTPMVQRPLNHFGSMQKPFYIYSLMFHGQKRLRSWDKLQGSFRCLTHHTSFPPELSYISILVFLGPCHVR